MFVGVYHQKIDRVGRLDIPHGFREQLAQERVFITAFTGPCIGLFPESKWEQFQALATQPPLLMPIDRTELDGEGRLQIAARFLRHAEIKTDVLVYGVGTFLELWSPEHGPRSDDWGAVGRPPPEKWDELDWMED